MSKTTKKMRDFFFLKSFFDLLNSAHAYYPNAVLLFKPSGQPGKTTIKREVQGITICSEKTKNLAVSGYSQISEKTGIKQGVVEVYGMSKIKMKKGQKTTEDITVSNSAGELSFTGASTIRDDSDYNGLNFKFGYENEKD